MNSSFDFAKARANGAHGNTFITFFCRFLIAYIVFLSLKWLFFPETSLVLSHTAFSGEFWLSICLTLVLVLTYVLLSTNREGLASLLIVASLYAISFFDVWVKGHGTRSESLYLLACVHLWVAVSFGTRLSRRMTVLSCALVLLLGYAEVSHWGAIGHAERSVLDIITSCLCLLGVYFGTDLLGVSFERYALSGIREAQAARDELLAVQKTEELVRGRFLGLMSHEIRTPLTTMKAAITLIRHPRADAQQKLRYLETLEKSIDSMTEVVGDLLLAHKSHSGATVLRELPTDIAALCQAACSSFQSAAETNGNRLNFTPCAAPLLLLADEVCLQQMVGYLLGNAIRHTLDGVISVEMLSEAVVDQQCTKLTVSVSDTGCGVSEDHQKNLFKMFSHLQNESDRNPAMGLGLFMVQMLARQMGGEAGFYSKTGQDSRFWFTIQLKNAV